MVETDVVSDDATAAWIAQHSHDDSRAHAVVVVLAVLWMAVVLYWTVTFWSMLSDAAPVLAMFEQEHGGALSYDEWLDHTEARAIFFARADADPSTNRIGRFIDASLVYRPVIALGGVATAVSGAVIATLNIATATTWHRRLTLAMLLVFCASLVPIVLYGAEIGALTAINE